MKPRERKLLIGLLAAAGVIVIARFGAGIWSALDLGDKIKEAREELAEYEEDQTQFDEDQSKYESYIVRTGDTDHKVVKGHLDARLNQLFQESNLRRPRITPKTATDDKNRITSIIFSFNAEGTWEEAMRFTQRVYELPYVAQFTSLKISPVGSRRQVVDRVKIDGDIEVLVVPKMKGVRVEVPAAAPEGMMVKYTQDDLLAVVNPFLEPVREVVAQGPEEDEPDDADGNDEDHDLWVRDPAGNKKYITAVWTSGGSEDVVRVAHRTVAGDRDWVAIGGELDGGQVVLVHPLGAVVRTPNGDDYVYALGESLSDAIPLEDAVVYPEIQIAMDRLEAVESLDEDFVGPPDLSGATADASRSFPAGEDDATTEDANDPSAADGRQAMPAKAKADRHRPGRAGPVDEVDDAEAEAMRAKAKKDGAKQADRSAQPGREGPANGNTVKPHHRTTPNRRPPVRRPPTRKPHHRPNQKPNEKKSTDNSSS